jgi:hypothetical protein
MELLVNAGVATPEEAGESTSGSSSEWLGVPTGKMKRIAMDNSFTQHSKKSILRVSNAKSTKR